MKTNKLFLFAALLGTALASCQKETEIQTPEELNPSLEKAWTLVVKATKDVDTKAMSLEGNTLTTYWVDGEKVNVFNNGAPLGQLEVTSTSNNGLTATLTGRIPADGLNVDSVLELLAPGRDDNQWTYLGQDGTAPSVAGTLASGYDYSYGTIKVTEKDEVNNVINATVTANFTTQQSLYRFTFTGGPSDVKEFTLFSNPGKLALSRNYSGGSWVSILGASLTVSPDDPTSATYFVALRNENTAAETYAFNVIAENGALYEGTKNIPAAALSSYRFLGATVSLTQKAFTPAATGSISTVEEVL